MEARIPARQKGVARFLAMSITIAGIVALVLFVGPSPGGAAGYTVQAKDFMFVAPNGGTSLTIRAGDKVTWVNTGGVGDEPHTITSGRPLAVDNRFPAHRGLLTSGQSFTTAFTSAGSYPYFCEIHPQEMTGVVKVLAASTPSPTVRPTTRPTRAPTAAPRGTPAASAAPTPTSSSGEAQSAVPSSSPLAGPSAVASAAPSPSADLSSPVVADGGGIAAPLLLGTVAAIGVAFLLRRVLRQRARRRE